MISFITSILGLVVASAAFICGVFVASYWRSGYKELERVNRALRKRLDEISSIDEKQTK